MENKREKFVLDALKIIAINHHKKMNDWEKEFVKNIQSLIANGNDLTNHQYNKLMEIKDKY